MNFLHKTANLFMLWMLVFAGAGMVGSTVYFHTMLNNVNGNTGDYTSTINELSQTVNDQQAVIARDQEIIFGLEQRHTQLQGIYTNVVQKTDTRAQQQVLNARPRIQAQQSSLSGGITAPSYEPYKPLWSSRFMVGDGV